MTELYLILHKVRGEPAFDIAQPLEIAGEEGWIIPTSGHRAYPCWYVPLAELTWNWRGNGQWTPYDDGFQSDDITNVPPVPADLRDHYQITETKVERVDLSALLGLKPQTLGLNRRI